MAVVQGNAALASDFNTLRGEINDWFFDPNASMTFGDGQQTYGWGGSAAAVVVAGNLMTAAQMNTLIDRCNIGEDICNVVTGQLSQIVAGNQMTAAEFNAIETKSDLIATNRLDIEAAELSLAAGGASARSTTWSAAIDCDMKYTFSNFAAARYFFNSGGAFNISGTITGYSTGTGWDGAGFNQIFTNMGTILMNYTNTTQSGSGGTPSSIGFYNLTAVNQLIFQQTGTGAYTDAVFQVYARRNSTGSIVWIQSVLTPGSGRSVNGTTTITSQKRKLIDQSSGAASLVITTPVYSLDDPL